MTVAKYLESLNKRFKTGIATEHTYRGDLQNLLESLLPELTVTNEATRIQCGAPDFILAKDDVPVGYIEAKDIGVHLDAKNFEEQFERYRASLDNLIFTDYLDFHLYADGEFVTSVRLAEVKGKSIVAIEANIPIFQNLIQDFSLYKGQTVTGSKKLAEMMAGKAKMLSVVIENALNEDESETNKSNTSLQSQLNAFKDVLIHDIKPKEFADIYAQTIAYGMFAARLHDKTLDTFTRQKAAELIPKTNPFLRKLFQFIAGYDLDTRIVWIVDGLANLFRATDVSAILRNFGRSTQTTDPIIHFYETFLAEYDPDLRKARGVWYTPEPVVNFIVRAVDDILKEEFNLSQGLADNSKIKIKVKIPTHDKRYSQGQREIEQELHKVQILDPATGTGTFLSEVVKQIYKSFDGQKGIWNGYVENHLIPRLNGFEILMASYAMAHLKLDLLLAETGYKSTKDQRFKIYLTNSLEEYHPDTGTLFANWLSSEANEANQIKRDTPVMVILGNPPYSGESKNKGEWISDLMNDYKKEPGGLTKLKERNPKWLNDDYVKFIRFGQYFIEKNGEGVLAFINPHGFLDNPTFRGMRWNLLKTYDKIYTIDLHGNSNKAEVSPDGTPDVNVFDILQGVAITLFIKTGKKKPDDLAKVFHHDIYGKREVKYDFLLNNSLKSVPYEALENVAPKYYFVKKDFSAQKDYQTGISINELFKVNSVGVVTANDAVLINESREELIRNVESHYNIRADRNLILRINYRPFDDRYIYYDTKLIERARAKVMQHFINGENIALMTCRQVGFESWEHIGITNKITDDSRVSNRSKERGYIYPLYTYPIKTKQQILIDDNVGRLHNLNMEIVKRIESQLSLTFTSEKQNDPNTFSPIDILDYIYAVLHSPTYRDTYMEFLRIDFPKVPYPKVPRIFWKLVEWGSQLRKLHLFDNQTFSTGLIKYPVAGHNGVSGIKYEDGKVFINENQYFSNVSEESWEILFGAYPPAQKWLKDRKDRTLTFEDIIHYQRILTTLNQTIEIMDRIAEIEIQ